MTTTPTTTPETFLCLKHAPKGVRPLPYDDGRPACAVCGKANYAVKPYPVPTCPHPAMKIEFAFKGFLFGPCCICGEQVEKRDVQ